MKKRAILYARVSTSRQAELYSLTYQLEQERQYAQDLGLTVVAEFADDMSGRKMEREGLTEARSMLADDKADVMIVWKLDRLHRNYINTVLLRDEIQKLGKELFYAQARMKSGATAKQRLPEDVMALMAEIEADEIVERTVMGKREKAERGGKWIGLNKPPYGYRKVGMRRDARLEIDDEQAVVVRDIFTWYVEGMTTLQIAEKLTALGIPTPNDLHPNRSHLKKRGFAEWSRNSVGKILKLEGYMGIFYQYKYKAVGGKSRANPNKDEWVGVPIPAIVSEALWREAERKRAVGHAMATRGTRFEYLVARRIFCECGYTMRASAAGKEHRLSDGSIKDYRYKRYRCPGRRPEAAVRCDR